MIGPLASSASELAAPQPEILIVGDLQRTSLAERLIGREETGGPQAELFSAMRSETASLTVVLGDMVASTRSSADWRHYDRLVRGLPTPIRPVMGNHDYPWWFGVFCCRRTLTPEVRARFEDLQRSTHYSDRIGDLGLVWLDSEFSLELQEGWLLDQLDEFERTGARAVVMFVHRAPYTNARGLLMGPDENVQRHFARHAVDRSIVVAVFSGHAHGYERFVFGGTHFFVSGGGGGPRRRYVEPSRFDDKYPGGNCAPGGRDSGKRPFNYQILRPGPSGLSVVVKGLCRHWSRVETLEQARIPYPSVGGSE
jgi:hypothetical protein